MDIEDTHFEADGIPSYIGKLTDLRILDVANTNFIGDLKGEVFQDLTSLIYLDIGGITFNSTIPEKITKLPNLKALYAYDGGLKGELEDILPNFKEHIFELWLDNNAISGTIPPEIGNLSSLASLSLSDNAITGSIPTEMGKLTHMQQMWLYANWMEGTVPAELGKMTELKILGIEDNNLEEETIPAEICKLPLIAFGADNCETDAAKCACCTCCKAPCPVATLPLFGDKRRLLDNGESKRRLALKDF